MTSDTAWDHDGRPDEDGTERTASSPAPEETGDIVIDAALADLAAAPPEDLDAQIAAGQRVHQTLHARLSDLGGD